MKSVITKVKQKQIAKVISQGKRLDGRGLEDHRPVELDVGIIESAEGSARVRLGKTEVMVGVKIEVGTPFSDVPEQGVLMVNAEFVPLASPTFESGPPDEDAVELARVVDRGIRESKAIPLENLCIEPRKKVFVVFVDVYVLNHDGNLIDASVLAALAALLNTKVFKYEVEEGEVEIKPGYTPLKIRNHPIAVTAAKIEDTLVLDPNLDEEQVMDARLTLTFDKDGKICAIQKGGCSHFTLEQVLNFANIGKKKSEKLREILVKK
jgi:exosome complex component RRP42